IPSPAPQLATAPARAPSAAAVPQVVMDVRQQVQVPSFVGMSIRQVLETAGAAGFEVEVAGSGTVREQAPLPGTLVAPGTRVLVRGDR
ncbi:MAG: PASTA domain-containing protein, partial [Terracidiphilus sp.]